jgi:hypothetical protein
MDATSIPDIESLSDAEAQRAVLLVYDRLPDDLWTDGKKPSLSSFEALADNLVELHHEDAACPELVRALLAAGNEDVKAAVARKVLHAFSEDPALESLVADAVSRATRPDMMELPLIVGACILGLSLCPRYESKGPAGARRVSLRFDPTGNAALLVDKLTALVRALRGTDAGATREP